jgi:hypothetical protein
MWPINSNKERHMKYLSIIFLFTISVVGQDLHMELNTEGRLECLRVTDSLDLTGSELYKKTLEWVASTYQNTEGAIQSEIKDQMIRIQKVSSEPIEYIFNWRIGYTVQIDIKDNKTRMRISDIVLLNLNNYSYGIELIVKNGKFKSSIESVNYRKGANEEFSRIYTSYLEALSNETESDNAW